LVALFAQFCLSRSENGVGTVKITLVHERFGFLRQGRHPRRTLLQPSDLIAKFDQFIGFLVKALGDVLVADTGLSHFDKDCTEGSDFHLLFARDLDRKLFKSVNEGLLRFGDTLPDLLLVEADIAGPDRHYRDRRKQYCDSQT